MRWERIVRYASALAVFLAGLGIYGLAVSLLTTGVQAFKTALSDPVNTLRYE